VIRPGVLFQIFQDLLNSRTVYPLRFVREAIARLTIPLSISPQRVLGHLASFLVLVWAGLRLVILFSHFALRSGMPTGIGWRRTPVHVEKEPSGSLRRSAEHPKAANPILPASLRSGQRLLVEDPLRLPPIPDVELELSELAIPPPLCVPAPVPVPPVADLSGSPLPPVPFVLMPPEDPAPIELPVELLPPPAPPPALCA
jgi:hypothetical protein